MLVKRATENMGDHHEFYEYLPSAYQLILQHFFKDH